MTVSSRHPYATRLAPIVVLLSVGALAVVSGILLAPFRHAISADIQHSVEPPAEPGHDDRSFSVGASREPVGLSVPQSEWIGSVLVSPPQRATFRFHFFNDSEEVNALAAVHPDCTCTDYQTNTTELLPGESGWIDITTTILGSGGFAAEVELEWSSRRRTSLKFSGRAVLRRELMVTPETVLTAPGEIKEVC